MIKVSAQYVAPNSWFGWFRFPQIIGGHFPCGLISLDRRPIVGMQYNTLESLSLKSTESFTIDFGKPTHYMGSMGRLNYYSYFASYKINGENPVKHLNAKGDLYWAPDFHNSSLFYEYKNEVAYNAGAQNRWVSNNSQYKIVQTLDYQLRSVTSGSFRLRMDPIHDSTTWGLRYNNSKPYYASTQYSWGGGLGSFGTCVRRFKKLTGNTIWSYTDEYVFKHAKCTKAGQLTLTWDCTYARYFNPALDFPMIVVTEQFTASTALYQLIPGINALQRSSTFADVIRSLLAPTLDRCILAVEALPRHVPQEIVTTICSNIPLADSNNLENLVQWSSSHIYKDFIPDEATIRLLKKGVGRNSIGPFIKAVASLYLQYKYAASLTPGDLTGLYQIIVDIIEWQTSQFPKRYVGYSTQVTDVDGTLVKSTGKCDLVPSVYALKNPKLLVMNQLGLLPTLSRMWDLVPYSFVIDWFTNFGSVLDSLEQSQIAINRWDLSYYLLSHKAVISLNGADLLPYLYGDLVCSYYERTITDQFPMMMLGDLGSKPTSHWLEGASLIVANS